MNWKLEVLSLRRSSVIERVMLFVHLMCEMIRQAVNGKAKNVLYYEEQAGNCYMIRNDL